MLVLGMVVWWCMVVVMLVVYVIVMLDGDVGFIWLQK